MKAKIIRFLRSITPVSVDIPCEREKGENSFGKIYKSGNANNGNQ